MQTTMDLALQLDREYARHRAELSVDKPWVGYFLTRQERGSFAYRIGHRRDPERRIVDWRSPLAEVYYLGAGEDFETDKGDGYAVVEGVLERKAAVTADGPRLTRVVVSDPDGEHALFATDDGFAAEGVEAPPSSVRGLPSLAALLTPAQYALITRSRARAVIIQGRAGSGKTSVALHRVAWLTYPAEDAKAPPLPPERVLVVMFNRALCEFVRGSLDELGLGAVSINTFHGWAAGCIKRAYKGSVEIVAGHGPGADVAARLKKRMGMLRALDAFVARQEESLDQWLTAKLEPVDALSWRDRARSDGAPVVRRLVRLRADARAARDAARGPEAERLSRVFDVLDQAVRRMTQYKEELLRMLSDEALLREHLDAAPDEVAALAAFQRALQSAGGADRRAGPRVAWEDLALLLRLIQKKNGGYPLRDSEEPVALYDHLVIDEAQDFGAVEMQALLHSVRDRASVTIVGDVNQKIVPQADFVGWDGVARALGVDGAEVTRLEVAHRSTAPIMALADGIVGDVTTGGRPGPRPRFFREADGEALFSRILLMLQDLGERSPDAHACVVCRHVEEAKSWAARLNLLLDGLLPVRYGHNDSFRFEPGVTVTNYRQVKGLEFDAVIVVDPSEENYPVDDAGRRALYVTCTRARERLDFVGDREPTALLLAAVSAGTLDLVDPAAAAPATLDEGDDDPL